MAATPTLHQVFNGDWNLRTSAGHRVGVLRARVTRDAVWELWDLSDPPAWSGATELFVTPTDPSLGPVGAHVQRLADATAPLGPAAWGLTAGEGFGVAGTATHPGFKAAALAYQPDAAVGPGTAGLVWLLGEDAPGAKPTGALVRAVSASAPEAVVDQWFLSADLPVPTAARALRLQRTSQPAPPTPLDLARALQSLAPDPKTAWTVVRSAWRSQPYRP